MKLHAEPPARTHCALCVYTLGPWAAEAKDEDSHGQGCERVTSRYDTPGNVEAQFEPGSGGCVLANKLGIADPKEMDDIELDLLVRLQKDVTSSVKADQPITVADLREWHLPLAG